MKSQEKILDRIQKLLNLSEGKGATPNEAANAAAQASRLMLQHGIEQAELDGFSQEEAEDALETKLWEGGKVVAWVLDLACGLSRLHQSRVLVYQARYFCGVSSGAKITIVGTPSNASVVRYMLTYLAREIDRLAKEESPEKAYKAGVSTRAYRSAFRKGAAREVLKRMRWEANEVKEEAQDKGQTKALLRLDKEEQKALQLLSKLSGGGSYTTSRKVASSLGFREGTKAGRKINVSRGLNSGSQDSGKLLS